jgi:ATP-binding cassette subfamily F protein uup
MNVLSLESVSKTLKDEPLFEGVSFGLEEGDHVALIGRNGQGKSTFLKLIAGQIVCDSGTIAMKNGTELVMLDQGVQFEEGATVASYLYDGQGVRIETYRAYRQALESEHNEACVAHLTEQMELLVAWNLENDYASLLGELGLYDIQDQRMDTLSGGMQKKVPLHGFCVPSPTMLLLDEPTNHLDIQTTRMVGTVPEKQQRHHNIGHPRPLLPRLGMLGHPGDGQRFNFSPSRFFFLLPGARGRNDLSDCKKNRTG